MNANRNTISIQKLIGKGYGAFWKTRKRYRVVKGSRGSKKSKTAAINRIYRIIKYPLSNYLCVRRYSNTLRDSIYADTLWAIHRMGLDNEFEWTKSPLEIRYKKTGQKILFRGLDSGLKITSIAVDKGFLNYVDIDEAYEISEDDFNKLDMSIRGELPEGYFKQVTLLFNPWSATSWLKKRFFDNPDDETFVKTTTWKCNEWLGEDDRRIFLNMKERNPRRYRIEGEGEWGIADGLIFPNHTKENFDIEAVKNIAGIRSAFGMDFGFTDPNAFVAVMIDDNARRIYVFDEWYKTNVTNKVIANQIKLMGYGSQRIVFDCAEPKSIAEIQAFGLWIVPAVKGADSITVGIDVLHRYKINVTRRSTGLIEELNSYKYKKDRDGKQTNDPVDKWNHAIDAVRYFALCKLNIKRTGTAKAHYNRLD